MVKIPPMFVHASLVSEKSFSVMSNVHPSLVAVEICQNVVIGGSFSDGFLKLLAGFCNQKHGMWDFVPELTTTSPYVNSNTFTMDTMQSYARVDSIPQSGT